MFPVHVTVGCRLWGLEGRGRLHTGMEGPWLIKAPASLALTSTGWRVRREGGKKHGGWCRYCGSQHWKGNISLPSNSTWNNSVTGPHLTSGVAATCNSAMFPGGERGEFGGQTFHPIWLGRNFIYFSTEDCFLQPLSKETRHLTGHKVPTTCWMGCGKSSYIGNKHLDPVLVLYTIFYNSQIASHIHFFILQWDFMVWEEAG